MKKFFIAAALIAACLSAFAEDYESFGTKYKAGVDYKVFQGFHLRASEAVLLDSSFGFDRSNTTVGATYRFNDWLKAGLDYSAIAVSKSYGLDWRHRLTFGVTESWKLDGFKFSFRESLMATYRTRDIDTYENPRTKLIFKTRAKVSYKPFHSRFTPYALAEMRLLLNGAKWSENDSGTWVFDGHSDIYFNRIAFQAGTLFHLDKQNALEFYAQYNYVIDKDVDAVRATGVFKSLTITHYPRVELGLGYTFSF